MGLTAVDLLAEMLAKGLFKAAALGEQVYQLLRHTAQWAGIRVTAGADFTAEIISRIFHVMVARLKSMALHAVTRVTHNLVPLSLVVVGGWALTSGIAI